ncbi:SDR family oxidoreductase [Flavobacterium sp. MFBS3-15]|uniref:SDR family NAD(P)-dependent oxidoreductase n=1 Tax=Flavobacterium sp. MFBS3-15 TaxID=2989816 RepID=UPI002235EBEE|nr:SDR family oxidoreductase [Flavobacterium sp. MFBS3-15]MCW4469817.1 SDR family oxidoreductase [Flavobacterium sp. MFBS3-15]
MSENKNFALITGATQGIGYELAKLFAADGYNLIIVARHQAELEQKAQEFSANGIQVISFAKDLFNRDEAFALCEEIQQRGIFVDVLVNNAGQGAYGLFQDNDIHKELGIVDLNIASTIILTKHFVKEMVARNSGKILNLASIASQTPGPWQAVYHATKAFVLSFSEALRSELKDTQITVTALQPGATDTDFFSKADMLDSKILQDKDALSDPADVAKDGYDALMAGKDKVVSGFKNKLQTALGNITPDTVLAEQTKKQQEPAKDN